MNSPGKSVLISIVGIVISIGVMVGAGFLIARNVRGNVDRPEAPSASYESVIPEGIGEFTSIYSAGGWTVNISYGDDYSVGVDGSARALEEVEVFQRGDTLNLVLNSGVQSVTGKLTATVVLPDLQRVKADGGVNITITDFDLDILEVEVDGAASVTARNGSIGDLSLDSDGAASFDFSRIRVKNARLDMDGASDLNIRMDGGDLTGVLRGVGNVRFSGDVANESVRVEGLGRVRRD